MFHWLSEAFDWVDHEKLLRILEDIEVPKIERMLIRNIYWNQTAEVRIRNDVTSSVEIEA